jgi:hypothetical protein
LRAAVRVEPRIRSLEAAELAWLIVLPCTALTFVAVALLGPPLGHAFLGPGSELFWPFVTRRPEPVEHGRYLVSLLGPLLASTVLVAGAGRPPALRPALMRAVAFATQLALLAFVALCLLAQHDVLLSADVPLIESSQYFTWPTLGVALALPPLLLAAMRARAIAGVLRAAVRETRVRRAACLALALLFAAAWLLIAIVTDASVGTVNTGVSGHILWSLDETFAILNGRTPLVDFHAQYGQLWPYLAAAFMSVFGASIGAWTLALAIGSGLALLAVYGIFRRLVRRSLLALVLFGPFVATSFFMNLGPLANRFAPANLYSLWPVRYSGAYLLAWLLVRHLDGAAPRRRWPLFLLGGLVVINNPEFGVPALVAMIAGLACARPPRSRTGAVRLVGELVAGLLGAAALVSLLTLLRAGALPRFGLLFEFSRLYGIGGWELLPMPRIGLYFVVYLTFAAAIVLAVVRAIRDEEPLLSAALAWSGTFGLLAGSYYVGRSHPQVLADLFSSWALSIALLTIATVRSLAARGWRRPTLAQLAVLFGFALTICSLPQTPTPWSQVQRLSHTTRRAAYEQPAATRFVAADTRRGEHVLILISLSHRIAYDLGVVNVSPYSSIESIPTLEQMRTAIAALRAAHGRKVFLSRRFTFDEELEALGAAGFVVKRTQRRTVDGFLIEMVDRRR